MAENKKPSESSDQIVYRCALCEFTSDKGREFFGHLVYCHGVQGHQMREEVACHIDAATHHVTIYRLIINDQLIASKTAWRATLRGECAT